ncbi:MAG: hypothetical protein PUF50_08745 [Erysipelotrichaceae bacterium]|nr:hypothetical protein [Erysipelotrichaceae bacterium]
MDFQDVKLRYQKKNQVLFSRDSACLQELLNLIRKQKHRTLVNWAFRCIETPYHTLQEHLPNEPRFTIAIDLCQQWASGAIKMPQARQAILQVHHLAKELQSSEDIALCHALAQGLSTIHVETHAIGLCFYECTALVRKYGINHFEEAVEQRIHEYIQILLECEKTIDQTNQTWAKFLLDDTRINKEQLLLEKTIAKNSHTA